MSPDELHTFLFDGLPVRGQLVRLTGAWTQLLARRAGNSETGAWPPPVAELLGEMAAAGVLMQAGIKFDGTLILQVFGDGPVKLAVAQVRSDLGLRATATVTGALPADASLPGMLNAGGGGRCAITLDPHNRAPGQQPYQGVVPLHDAQGHKFTRLSDVLQHYMRQSEQLDTTLALAANQQVAAGLLIQRMPGSSGEEDGDDEDYRRIATLAASLTREELLTLQADAILRRLFWQERLLRFEPRRGADGPRFHCTCSRERVARMLHGLGEQEVRSILTERGNVEVGCEFCGQQYRFDAVDAARLFTAPGQQPPASARVQ